MKVIVDHTNRIQEIAVLLNIIFFAVKKSYYRLALVFHPDRVEKHEKHTTNEKFHIIHQAYLILSDTEKRQQYDNGSDVFFTHATIAGRWESYMKIIQDEDIDLARERYQDSIQEAMDIAREFLNGNGSMSHLLNEIPFMRVEDENRILQLIRDFMKNGTIPEIRVKMIPKVKVNK